MEIEVEKWLLRHAVNLIYLCENVCPFFCNSFWLVFSMSQEGKLPMKSYFTDYAENTHSVY